MKRSQILLGLLLSLCLLFSLTGPAAADKAENLVKYMDTGGWPPELLGSWIGNMWESCSQFTFNHDGSYSEMVFEFRSRDQTGTVFTLPETWKTSFEGDILHLSMYAGTGDFHRIEVPYVRLTAWDETAAASVDPEILGTFGGRWKGGYIEWTFHGDGSFTQVTPYDELEESGYYTAGGGALAIHLDDEIILCKYYKTRTPCGCGCPTMKSNTFWRNTARLNKWMSLMTLDGSIRWDRKIPVSLLSRGTLAARATWVSPDSVGTGVTGEERR